MFINGLSLLNVEKAPPPALMVKIITGQNLCLKPMWAKAFTAISAGPTYATASVIASVYVMPSIKPCHGSAS